CTEIRTILDGVGVASSVLTNSTRLTLLRALSDNEPQIVHFIGHGTFDAETGEGALLLSDEFGLEDPLPASALATVFTGKPTPRLVILSACLTATSRRGSGPFAAVAVAAVAAGLPAVIAMQSEVFDRNV